MTGMSEERNYLHVVRGDPDEDELAALVVAVTLCARPDDPDGGEQPTTAVRAGGIRPARYAPPGSWTRHNRA